MAIDVAAIVLAAGAGRRFGGPKALARHRGRTWLAIAVAKAAAANYTPICAVIGCGARDVRAAAGLDDGGNRSNGSSDRLQWVENPLWERGRTGSIIAGLAALPADVGGTLIHPVDFVYVRAETMARLRAAFVAAPRNEDVIVVPQSQGRRGHPIVLGRAVWAEVMALGPDEPLHRVVRRRSERVRAVAVEDIGIHRNVNTRRDAPPG